MDAFIYNMICLYHVIPALPIRHHTIHAHSVPYRTIPFICEHMCLQYIHTVMWARLYPLMDPSIPS